MSKSRPFFSIVVPTYNRASKILSTIESVIQQELDDWELIIVDDGSTDDTDQIVELIIDERIKYVQTVNRERAAARNVGIQHSKGHYITFLDSDDRLKIHHLKTARDFLIENSNVDFFRLAYEVRDIAKNRIVSVSVVGGDLNEALINGNFLSCLGVFVRKEVLTMYQFNEDRELSGCEDYELWLRLSCRFKLYGLNEITAELHQHGDRSVLYEPFEKLVRRVDLLYIYLVRDEKFIERYGRHLNSFRANNFTYVSLHLAISNYKWSAIQYLIRAFFKNPGVLYRRRTYAIIKLILS